MEYRYPFGQVVQPLVQQDQSTKQAFVLGAHSQRWFDAHQAWEKAL